jgi:predicted Ser/Thr protein kinase
VADQFAHFKTAISDRYEIERELGRGGMAVVFLALDRKHNRPVVLKVLRPEVSMTLGAQRFLREVSIAAKLSHPHVVTLIDSDEIEGFLFSVMAYVEGESLRERLVREGSLELGAAMEIVRQVASALDYAHSRDVVHRDVKPENILLCRSAAVVTDFGIARAISEATEGERLTDPGIAVGTSVYMSPEQASGEIEVDGRSDVYALGCVLYELLTGEGQGRVARPARARGRDAEGSGAHHRAGAGAGARRPFRLGFGVRGGAGCGCLHRSSARPVDRGSAVLQHQSRSRERVPRRRNRRRDHHRTQPGEGVAGRTTLLVLRLQGTEPRYPRDR